MEQVNLEPINDNPVHVFYVLWYDVQDMMLYHHSRLKISVEMALNSASIADYVIISSRVMKSFYITELVHCYNTFCAHFQTQEFTNDALSESEICSFVYCIENGIEPNNQINISENYIHSCLSGNTTYPDNLYEVYLQLLIQ